MGTAGAAGAAREAAATRGERGRRAEALAWRHLARHGLRLVARNYRWARGPSRRAGEIDLICREPDGTLVFVEVRSRRGRAHGGAAASVDAAKRAALVLAAQAFLATRVAAGDVPPCRFDVVAFDGDLDAYERGTLEPQWLRAAFDADGAG